MLPIRRAAALTGVHAETLRRWEREGKLKPERTLSGQRRYSIQSIKRLITNNGTRDNYIYCRVSSTKQKADLERQIEYMQTRYPDYKVISDIASGVNYNRPGLQTLLQNIMLGNVRIVAVSCRDRIGRFGLDLFQQVASFYKTEIVVAMDEDLSPQEEIAEDIIAIITSFAAKVHGKRKYKRRGNNEGENPQIEDDEPNEENNQELDQSEPEDI